MRSGVHRYFQWEGLFKKIYTNIPDIMMSYIYYILYRIQIRFKIFNRLDVNKAFYLRQ